MSERDLFKLRLRRRDVMFGCFVGQPAPAIAEMVGYAGFDYVIVDLEHGPTGLETLENMLRAAQAAGAASLVPPAQSGAGRYPFECSTRTPDGILVPHVESAADARAVVAHAYYPPAGQRGISTVSRAARHLPSSVRNDTLAGANERTAVMLMVESPGAVARVRFRSSRSTASTGSSSDRTISPRRSAMSATATTRTCKRRSATSCGARRRRDARSPRWRDR